MIEETLGSSIFESESESQDDENDEVLECECSTSGSATPESLASGPLPRMFATQMEKEVPATLRCNCDHEEDSDSFLDVQSSTRKHTMASRLFKSSAKKASENVQSSDKALEAINSVNAQEYRYSSNTPITVKGIEPRNVTILDRTEREDNLATLKDRKAFDNDQLVISEEGRFEHDDCVDTYGMTVLRHFKKQELEREYHMHEKPSFLTRQMKLLLVAAEVIIIALIGLFVHWIVLVRKQDTLQFPDLWKVVWPNKDASINEENRLNAHMIIYVVTFVVLLPHVLILSIMLEFVSPNRLTTIIFLLKLLSFFLFFGGFGDIEDARTTNATTTEVFLARDYKTHRFFSICVLMVFITYILVTAVNMAGHMFRNIFYMRFIGRWLRILASDWFSDLVDHLVYGVGYISLLTGISTYLYIDRNKAHFRLLEMVVDKYASAREQWHIRSIVILLATLYLVILLANNHKHFIKNHKVFLQVEDFQKIFLRFRSLYEEDNIMEMGQDMPKVTSAQRML